MLGLAQLFRIAPNENFEVKRWNRIRLAGSYLAVPLLLWFAYRTARPELAPWLMRALGVLTMSAGVGLRSWALGCIDGRKKKVLVTWGPYRHVRHPLYCASLLLALGACTFAGAPLAGLLAAGVYLALYLPSIRAEERFLAVRFGAEWETYREGVPAFVPRVGVPAPGAEPAPFRWPLAALLQPALLCGVAIAASEILRASRGIED